eukprot:TRINITY_DN1156_c0_g2_i1.p1 TRINITY_DN1156_c0_g2~~TRINITY_DN1156_c0_g2_i1.p1  ORF type:complete len:425 (-),score=129.25 TRINITY_DN1156_c0_g2_i1:550-1824(-)
MDIWEREALHANEVYVGEIPTPGRGSVVIRARGGEFRIMFSPTTENTRNIRAPNLCFVIGKNENTESTVGIGNPSYIEFDTTYEPEAVMSNDYEQLYWFSFDQSIGMAAFGVGTPGENIQLLVKSAELENMAPLKHIGLSNWIQHVHLEIESIDEPFDLLAFSHKFNADGSPKRFRGNSLICFVDKASKPFEKLVKAQELIAASPLAPYYALLEPSSFHVTVCDLFVESRRKDLLPDTSWADIDQFVNKRTADLRKHCWGQDTPLKMGFQGLSHSLATVALQAVGDDNKIIQEWRDKVHTCTNLEPPVGYQFHTSFAYQIFPFGEGDKVKEAMWSLRLKLMELLQGITFELRNPTLCLFTDMNHFAPVDPDSPRGIMRTVSSPYVPIPEHLSHDGEIIQYQTESGSGTPPSATLKPLSESPPAF